MDKYKKHFGYAFIVFAIVFNTILFVLLPDTLVMQISGSGEPGTTMPKLLGLGLIVAIELFIGYQVVVGKFAEKSQTWILAMAIITIVNVLVLLFNL